jgi:hypothetical protein
MKRGAKLTALAVVIVLALTGFSSGRGGGSKGGSKRSGSSHSSSSGGGCSSSKQNHDSSSSSRYDDDDDSYGSSSSGSSSGYSSGSNYRRPGYGSSTSSSSGSGSSKGLRDGRATLIKCADSTHPYALVRVVNPNRKSARFDVHVAFDDSASVQIADGYDDVKVPADGTTTLKVRIGNTSLATDIAHCEVDPEATLAT